MTHETADRLQFASRPFDREGRRSLQHEKHLVAEIVAVRLSCLIRPYARNERESRGRREVSEVVLQS